HIYRRKAKYNPCTLANRFGGWTSVPEAFRNFAKGKRKWADVVALLPGPQARVAVKKKERGRPNGESVPRTPASKRHHPPLKDRPVCGNPSHRQVEDRKSTRLNSSHRTISYAVFCLKKKNELLMLSVLVRSIVLPFPLK